MKRKNTNNIPNLDINQIKEKETFLYTVNSSVDNSDVNIITVTEIDKEVDYLIGERFTDCSIVYIPLSRILKKYQEKMIRSISYDIGDTNNTNIQRRVFVQNNVQT